MSAGKVYFVIEKHTGRLKIGKTTKDPKSRLKELSTGSSSPLVLIGWVETDNYDKKEKELHCKFNHLRIHGEWFSPGAELVDAVYRQSTHLCEQELVFENSDLINEEYDCDEVFAECISLPKPWNINHISLIEQLRNREKEEGFKEGFYKGVKEARRKNIEDSFKKESLDHKPKDYCASSWSPE